ncbi:Molybdenum cofactor cytidylyltransferase [Clostridium formicaceticum]|nr:Molybdenum cofactor cytidylyltransferase [Clostridium formicaceticum]
MRNQIGAIIIAAGLSSRMKIFKPLLKIGKKTAVEMAVTSMQQAGIQEILVVTGYQWERIADTLDTTSIQLLVNEQYMKGMYSSIVKGVTNLSEKIKAFFLLPVDIPLIKSRTLQEIMTCYDETQAGIVYPVFNDIKGHPPLISTKYKEAIIANNLPGGLRSLLENYERDTAKIEVVDAGITMDMDTQDDYVNLLEYYLARSIPNEAECRAILKKFGTPMHILQHGEKVAMLACSIGKALNEKGYNFNRDLLRASGMLHDIAKGRPCHAEAGGEILMNLGYPQVAKVIAAHMEIETKDCENITEEEIIYLADKMVNKCNIVSLEDRLRLSYEKYCHQPQAFKHIERRLKEAGHILNKIIKITGLSEERIIAFDQQGESK